MTLSEDPYYKTHNRSTSLMQYVFECFRAGATSDFRPQVTAPSERKVPAINGSVSNRRNDLPCSRIREEEGSLENNDRPDNKSVAGNGDEAETEEDEEEQMLREFEEYDEQVCKRYIFSICFFLTLS